MSKPILAVDPGTSDTAFLRVFDDAIGHHGHYPNETFLDLIRDDPLQQVVAVEMVACYGMPVGKEVFETCLIIGRIQEICLRNKWECRLVYRKDVKIHLCGSMKAKDSNIRQALIDKYGAPGTKSAPGRLYGIKSHLWSALAIADYALSNPTP